MRRVLLSGLMHKAMPHNSFEELKVIGSVNPDHQEILFSRSGKKLQDVYSRLKSGKAQSFSFKYRCRIKNHYKA